MEQHYRSASFTLRPLSSIPLFQTPATPSAACRFLGLPCTAVRVCTPKRRPEGPQLNMWKTPSQSE